jgi:hypothetical protein
MIKTEDLRKGNKVKCKISNDAGIYTVLGIPAWGIDGNGDGEEPLVLIDRCPKQLVPESKLKPIPLTPEILEAGGFENRANGIYKNDLFNICRFENNKYFLCNPFGTEIYSPMKLIEYLHQLQNLYYSLMGKELEVNIHKETTT